MPLSCSNADSVLGCSCATCKMALHSATVTHGIQHHKNAAKTQTSADFEGSADGDPLSSSMDHGKSVCVNRKSCL